MMFSALLSVYLNWEAFCESKSILFFVGCWLMEANLLGY